MSDILLCFANYFYNKNAIYNKYIINLIIKRKLHVNILNEKSSSLT